MHKPSGFTLTELLVGMFIASTLISSLLYMVVELLQTNQKELAQTETQGDMQHALDFISSELREAVYVYGGDCLQGQGTLTNGVPSADYCPGIVNYIPDILTNSTSNSVPILAFWKLERLPEPLRVQCNNNNSPATVPCTAGRTYSLIVYFLRKNQSTDPTHWSGKARITRYALTQYNSQGIATANYVEPEQVGVTFRIWPYKNNGGSLTNLQASKPTVDAFTLVDFVDDTVRSGDNNVSCPNNYALTPTSNTLSNNSYASGAFSGVRSFYACVRGGTGDGIGFNQDVFVFLRGNASGRVGINNDSFLPTLQAQVLKHGLVNKVPLPLQ